MYMYICIYVYINIFTGKPICYVFFCHYYCCWCFYIIYYDKYYYYYDCYCYSVGQILCDALAQKKTHVFVIIVIVIITVIIITIIIITLSHVDFLAQ